MLNLARALVLLLLGPALAGLVSAEGASWPARPIRLVVAQAIGGPPDLIGRYLADRLGPALNTSVVVENRPGAGGIIGVDSVAHAAADGYTMLIGTLSTHALVPHANKNVPYDALRDFAPIVNLFRSIKVLWINAALPVANFAEWIAYTQARGGQLNYASGGVGSSNHIDMALLEGLTNLRMVHVPYNGPNAAITAVGRGDAQAMVVSIGTGIALAQSGQIRPLLVFSDRRSPLLPDVPTAAEAGFARLELAAWIGLMAPAGVAPSVVDRVNAETVRILRSPETLAWANRQGLDIVGGTPDDFSSTMAADFKRWGDVLGRTLIGAE